MKIAVLIPTRGDRPTFLEQAKRMLAYQTLRPDKVYIVDYPPTPGVYDTERRTRMGLEAAVRDGIDRLYTWDDDEYYAPTYLEYFNTVWSDNVQAAGIVNIPYYHLHYRRAAYREYPNFATNSCTAFVPKAAVNFVAAQTGYEFDQLLWAWLRRKCLYRFVRQRCVPFQVIGMKHQLGSLTAGAHFWPPEMYGYDDADTHWLQANVDKRVVDFYLNGAWKNG